MAPEAITDQGTVGLPADIWSVGAMMFQILCGKYPYGAGLKAVPLIIAALPPTLPGFVTRKAQFKPLAEELANIINGCLQKDPVARPTADDLVGMCNSLCYSVSDRQVGRVTEFRHNAFGYINNSSGRTFYHKDSVFGTLPAEGDDVLFSSYDGGQSPRALPVLKLG
jgi:serine/threonine-protein kinase